MKPLRHNKILSIDIEATCWDEGQEPPGFISEIIEVGIAVLNTEKHTIDKTQSLIVKPKYDPKISEYCTNLTGITQEQVDKGMTFEKACKILRRDYGSKNLPWASFGDTDRQSFIDHCARRKDDTLYPFSNTHINIALLTMLKFNIDKRPSMMDILEKFKLTNDGKWHSGVSDAYNTARIIACTLWDLK